MIVWLGSVAAVATLVVSFAIWRLMQGPIELDRLAPYVEAAFNRYGAGLGMTISGVRLGIDRRTHELDLWLENVHVLLPDRKPAASFPEMATSFSLRSLLRGRLAPTKLVVERPVIHLQRDKSGKVSFQIGSPDQAAPELGPQLLADLTGREDAPLALMRRLSIRDATVILDDESTGRRWQADRVDAAVTRDGQEIAGDLSLAFALAKTTPELHVGYRYAAAQQTLDVQASVEGIDPVALASLFPTLTPLGQIHSPISGTLATRFNLAAGTSEGVRLDLGFGRGSLQNPMLPGGSLAVAAGDLRAVYAPEKAELRLEKFGLDLGGGSYLVLKGNVTGLTPEVVAAQAPPPAELEGKLSLALSQVPAERLGEVWPAALSPGGRRWVLANISEGMLDEAAAELALRINTAAQTAEVLAASGSLRYHGLTIRYFPGLRPVREVGGTASFAGKRLEFTPTSGSLKSLKLTGGSLQITDLGMPTEWLTIDLAMAGPLKDALETLDQKPLRYAQALAVDPAHIGGRVQTQLHFKLPLFADLKLAAIEYGAKATLGGVSIAKVALERNLSDGDFALEVTRSGAELKGRARFDGTPSTIDAEAFFRPGQGPHSRYRIVLELDDDARRRLGLDLAPDRMHGPVGVDLTYTIEAAGHARAVALIDLARASLAVAEAGWKKPAAAPGTAKLSIDLVDQTISRPLQLEVRAAGLDGRFAAELSADRQSINRVDIRRLVLGDDELSGTVTRRAQGGWRADLRGARFDAHHVFKAAATEKAPPVAPPPLAVNAAFDRVTFGAGRELRGVSAHVLREGGVWQQAEIDGRYADGHQVQLRLGGAAADGQLSLRSDDLGATLRLFDITSDVVGGRVNFTGHVSDDGGKRVVRGHVEGTGYSLVQAPAFARVLALPSLSGFASSLSGSGIPFTTLRADFSYSGDHVNLGRLVAYGEALGVTANGWFDIDRDRLDLQGTIAPAFLLNSILGIVPVIGPLVTGGEGQGVFAANYRISGPSAKPEVSVNPLSALAPGFLRQLFQPWVAAPPVPQGLDGAPQAAAPR